MNEIAPTDLPLLFVVDLCDALDSSRGSAASVLLAELGVQFDGNLESGMISPIGSRIMTRLTGELNNCHNSIAPPKPDWDSGPSVDGLKRFAGKALADRKTRGPTGAVCATFIPGMARATGFWTNAAVQGGYTPHFIILAGPGLKSGRTNSKDVPEDDLLFVRSFLECAARTRNQKCVFLASPNLNTALLANALARLGLGNTAADPAQVAVERDEDHDPAYAKMPPTGDWASHARNSLIWALGPGVGGLSPQAEATIAEVSNELATADKILGASLQNVSRSAWDAQNHAQDIAYQSRAAQNGVARSKAVRAQLEGDISSLKIKILGVLQLVRSLIKVNLPGLSSLAEDLKDTSEARISYGEWVRKYDTLSTQARETIGRQAETLARTQHVSIVIEECPDPNTLVRATLNSITDQIAGTWEVIVPSDGLALGAPYDTDPRIRLTPPQADRSFFLLASEIATGNFLLPLSPGTLLAPHALYRLAEAYAANPNLVVLYGDDDEYRPADPGVEKINHIERSSHRFKPDWNREMFRAINYIGDAVFLKTDFVRKIAHENMLQPNAEVFDAVLRADSLCPDEIVHSPGVMTHLRPSAPAVSTLQAEHTALANHFARIESDAHFETLDNGTRRIRYPVPDFAPLVSVIIPTRDRKELLENTVTGVLSYTDYLNLEVIIVDNASTEPDALAYLESISKHPSVTVVRDATQFNFPRLNELGVQASSGEIVALLNNDLSVIHPGWLTELVSHALRPKVGIVSAKLHFPDDTIQHAGIILGVSGTAGHAFHREPSDSAGYCNRLIVSQNTSAVTGACLVLRRAVYDELGGMNAEELPVMSNDLDLCLRAVDANYDIIWTPHAQLYHHEGASRDVNSSFDIKDLYRQESEYMERRWPPERFIDPYYNPNLTLNGLNFGLASPPRLPADDSGADPAS